MSMQLTLAKIDAAKAANNLPDIVYSWQPNTAALHVEKAGFERALYVFAHDRPWSYGLAAMAFALGAGWAASRAFRRD